MLPTYGVDGPGALSPEQIGEVLLQTATCCGVPAANTAFAVAQRTLAEDANA